VPTFEYPDADLTACNSKWFEKKATADFVSLKMEPENGTLWVPARFFRSMAEQQLLTAGLEEIAKCLSGLSF